MAGARVRARVSIELVYDGRLVGDEALGLLLLHIDACGSILCAARSLGIPYSRAWERIARAERVLGVRIVEARKGGRGGGGARLTQAGRELLAVFLEAYRRVHRSDPPLVSVGEPVCKGGVVLYAGSHDIAFQSLVGMAREEGLLVEAHWVGSLRGLASMIMGEADIAGIHVLDPATGEYNVHLVKSIGREAGIALIRGYERLQGFITRKPMGFDEIVEGLLAGRLRLINRERGTGTRILLESILRREAGRRGVTGPLDAVVAGWSSEAKTHVEVAEAVAEGRADVGFAIQAAAEVYGLHFTPASWERFDFLVPAGGRRGELEKLIELLCSERFQAALARLKGYRVPSDACRLITP